ncbi:hypothetical protein JW711_00210 [Candidatus Woesearchaeota archaeon]|nr:hypothetical protein [Candidatus Woesearchaeota archaeon]
MAFFDLSLGGTIYQFAELIGAPFKNPNLLWFGLPLIITIIIIELNLGLGKKASFGLKQALPNAIILFFVFLNSAQVTFSHDGGFVSNLLSGRNLATFFILLLSVAVFMIEYLKEFPKKQFFGFSAHLPINVLAYVFMVVVNNEIAIDLNLFVAYILLTILFSSLFFTVARMEPGRMETTDLFGSSNRHRDIFRRRKGSSHTHSYSHEHTSPKKGLFPKRREEDYSDTIADPFRGVKGR